MSEIIDWYDSLDLKLEELPDNLLKDVRFVDTVTIIAVEVRYNIQDQIDEDLEDV
jgi:hypothetical protein